jgi:hypothetical protein
VLIAHHPTGSTLATAVGSDVKGRVSVVIYVAAVAVAFRAPWLACALYVAVAVMWLVPDRRIEKALKERGAGGVRRLDQDRSGVARTSSSRRRKDGGSIAG